MSGATRANLRYVPPVDSGRSGTTRYLVQPILAKRRNLKDPVELWRYKAMLLPRRIRTDAPTADEALYNLLMTMLEIEVENPAAPNSELVSELRQVIGRLTKQ